MGWLWKGLALLVAVMLFGTGAWAISLLIFAFVFLPPILKRGRGKPSSQGDARPKHRFPVRAVLGGGLILLALLALAARGTYSPIFFGSLGALVILWGRIPRLGLSSAMRPVDESILLRSSPLGLSWAAVAEVKLLARDAGRALAGFNGTVLVSMADKPSVHLLVESTALSERSAEESIVATLRETAFSLSPLGAYILPLDAKQAQTLLQPSLQASKMEKTGWSTALESGTYDLVSVKQEKGFAKSIGVFRRVGPGQDGLARIPSAAEEFAHPPFLMEVFKALGGRFSWPQPDQQTAFLSSMFATGGEPLGTRVLDTDEAPQSQMVVVRSQGSPSVELSRAQLRAVVRMYDRGAR